MNVAYVTPFRPSLRNGGGLLAYGNLAALCSFPGAVVDYVGLPPDGRLPLLEGRPLRMALARPYRARDRLRALATGSATSVSALYGEWQAAPGHRIYDWVFVESTRCGFAVRPEAARYGVLVMAQNVEFDYMRRTQRGLNRLATLYVRRSERLSLRRASVLLVLHAEDRRRFQSLYGADLATRFFLHPAYALPPAHSPMPWKQRPRTLVYAGSLNQAFNEEGLLHFLASAWPTVARTGHGFTVAGRDPSPRLRRILSSCPGVRLIPNPPDMSLILREARLLVLPDPYGMGMKFRVAEALSLGVPVVGTRLGFLGYEPVDAFGAATESIADMGNAVCRILEDDALASRLAQQAVDEWSQRYSFAAFERRVHSLLSRPATVADTDTGNAFSNSAQG
jgi:glycosyltransferase involved in cell wall biosynthesis